MIFRVMANRFRRELMISFYNNFVARIFLMENKRVRKLKMI